MVPQLKTKQAREAYAADLKKNRKTPEQKKAEVERNRAKVVGALSTGIAYAKKGASTLVEGAKNFVKSGGTSISPPKKRKVTVKKTGGTAKTGGMSMKKTIVKKPTMSMKKTIVKRDSIK